MEESTSQDLVVDSHLEGDITLPRKDVLFTMYIAAQLGKVVQSLFGDVGVDKVYERAGLDPAFVDAKMDALFKLVDPDQYAYVSAQDEE